LKGKPVPTKIKVLIVEDRSDKTDLALHELRQVGFEPEWRRVDTESDYLAQLDQAWEIILADDRLPQFDGMHALKLLRDRDPDLPFILVSETMSETMAVAAMKAGANDYIIKGRQVRLGPVVERELRGAVERREHKRAAAAARESEERFRLVQENSPDAIFLTAPDGSIFSANPAACEMLQRTEEEICRMGRNGLVDLEDPRLPVLLEERARTGKARGELTMLRKDGSKFPVEISTSVFVDRSGEKRTSMIIRDISGRRRAEDALAASEEKFRKAFYTNPDAVSITRLADGMYVSINTGFTKSMGYSEEDIAGRTSIGLNVWDDLDERQRLVTDLRKNGVVENLEARFRTKNGDLKQGLIAAALIDIDRQPHILSLIRDITDRKRLDEKLGRSEERFRQLSDLLPQIVFETDIEGNLTFANRYGLRSFGYSPEDSLAGLNFFMFVAPEDRERIGKRVQEILGGSESAVREYQMIRKDGSLFPAMVHATAILKDGVPIGVRGIGIDITERKRTEEEVRRMAKDLQKKDDELTRFTTAVLHDLRSPLVTIQTFRGFLERDIRSRDEERIEKDLGYIRGAADRIGCLFDELQLLSRVGVVIHPSQDAPLQAIVQEALDLVAGRISERKVRVDITEEPVILWGDQMRLVEVFQNLVDNAAKFMGDEPAPRVEIGVEQAGEDMVLYVRDNGIGIDPNMQAGIFGLFQKLDPETEGTGIGLALVKRIVELHGGRIWVESEGAGKGTTVRFTLAKTRRHL
jgi:PAS domain S-box-containing protein